MALLPKPGDVFHGEDGSVSVVLPDLCDPNADPTREEVEEYAEWLGIDVVREPGLLGIAREGLLTPLPPEWRACRTGEGDVYYFNFDTGESSWDHPMDEVFKRRIQEARVKSVGHTVPCEDEKGKDRKSKVASGGKEPRYLEKGAAGHVESSMTTGKNVINSAAVTPSPRTTTTTSASLSFRTGKTLGTSTSTVRPGRLGALGTPEAAQRRQPDVSGLLASPLTKTDRSLTRFTPSGGNSNDNGIHNSSNGIVIGNGLTSSLSVVGLSSGLGRQTRTVDGAKDLEAHIRQRIDDEVNGRRRAMRLRHEKELADEREISAAALQKAKWDNEQRLEMERQQQQQADPYIQAKLQAAQKALERQYTEANERVAALRSKLQHEKVSLENNLCQAIAEAKEKSERSHTERLAEPRATLADTLKQEQERLTSHYAKNLESESKVLERKKKTSLEDFEKELNTAQLKFIEELAAKQKESTTPASTDPTTTTTTTTSSGDITPTSKAVEEAQKAYEAAVQQATAEAATAMETLRREYTARVEKLQASKAEKLRAKDAGMRASNGGTSDHIPAKQKEEMALVEAEEARLRKALDEKASEYAEETRRLVAAKRSQVQSVKPTPTTTGGRNNKSGNTGNNGQRNNGVSTAAGAVQEQRRFDVASRQLDAKHEQTMMRIRNEHTRALRERNLSDPRDSPEYFTLVQAQQKAWLSEHPTPTQTTPQQDYVSSTAGDVTLAPSSLLKGEEELQKNSSIAGRSSSCCGNSGNGGNKSGREEPPAELDATLEQEVKEAVDAYRTKRMEEIRAELTQYRETLAEQHQRRLTNLSTSITAEAEARALAEYPVPLLLPPSSPNTSNTTTTTTATTTTVNIANRGESSKAEADKTGGTLSPHVSTVTREEAQRREEELRQRLQARIDVLQEILHRAELELRQKLDEVQQRTVSTANATVTPSPTETVWQRPPPFPTPATTGMLSARPEQVGTPRFRPQLQPQPHDFSTPVLNRTLSTIPPVNSLWSSSRPSPTRQLSCLDAGSPLLTLPLNDISDGVAQEGGIDNSTAAAPPKRDIVFEDRLRRAKLLLKDRKEGLRTQQTRIKRARELWLRDMKDCHKRHDRERALLLRQVKVALEQKAEQLNREVIDMSSASAWILNREAEYRQSLSPQKDIYPSSFRSPHTPLPDTPGSGESKHIIRLLQSILTRTEMLESYIASPRRSIAVNESSTTRRQPHVYQQQAVGRQRAHSQEQFHRTPPPQSHRPHNRHVDAAGLGVETTPGDIGQWLLEQQLTLLANSNEYFK